MLQYIITQLTQAEVTITQILVSNCTNLISFKYYISDNCTHIVSNTSEVHTEYQKLNKTQVSNGGDRMTDGWQVGPKTTVGARYSV
jgi:hypothetical protein